MNIALRRRLAFGVVATATAVVAGLVAAPTANAGNVTVTPSFAYNNDDSETLVFNTQSDMVPDPAGMGNVEITLTRTGTTTDTITATNDGFTDPNAVPATFNFKDTGSAANDGPANPGTYNVKIEDTVSGAVDTCQGCFTVFASAPISIASAAPNAIAAGGADNVTFTGNGFTRGTKVEILLAGTSTPDPAITIGAPTKAGTPQQCFPNLSCSVEDPDRTTATTLKRRVSITTAANAGPRDIRVTAIDGTTAVCTGCFTVNGAPLSGVSPQAVDNNPAATGTVKITFTGSNVPQGGTPTLVFIGNAGSSTKDALTLTGTNPTYSTNSVTADFDVRSAAPGLNAYVPTITAPNGSTNTCTCRFSVGQASPPTISSLSPNTAAQSDSKTVTINGSNLSKGVRITFSGTGIDVTGVQWVSSTQVRATVQVQGNATAGKRDVTASTTGGPTGDSTYPKTGPACAGCFTVTASGSPSASPTSTVSPQGCPGTPLTTIVNTKTINATGLASVTVRGATPSATIELQGYSQNHYGTANFDNDPTPVDRVGTADSNGAITFNNLRPASNTRVHARQKGCGYGNSAVIEVRAMETLEVVRNGVRSYTFKGRSIPARPGGLIVSLYRITGRSCAAGVEPRQCPGEKFIGQARAVSLGSPGEGLYSIRITFPRADQNVRDEFVVKTGRDAQNAPGRSNVRSLLIY